MDLLSQLRSRYLRQPHEVSIETYALCNASCGFCPYIALDRKGAKMPEAVVFDLIDQMASFTEAFFISPFKVNEPLLDDRLAGICRRIVEFVPNAKIRLFTNGSPLHSKHVEWIANLPPARLEHLWVSLNSTDPQEYGELMKLSYSMTANRLDELHQRKRKREVPHEVVLSRVVQDDVESNTRFVDECVKRWPLFEPFLIKRDGWLGYVEPSSKLPPRSGCGRWFELSILATGRVALCCMDGTGQYDLGSVQESKLLTIYNQPALLNRREFQVTRAGIDPCERCTY
jgi:Radical SAM superfamily/Iron-sulfur cluster-binding domain